MADKTTYIKVDRNILKWRWWNSHNTLIVFLWLLLNANVTDHDFMTETIHRGQIATSLKTIASHCHITINEARTTLEHLKSTGEITCSKRPHYQVITIVQYARYQDVTRKNADEAQTKPTQTTCKSQQYKNGKNNKNGKNIPPKSPTGGLDPSGGSSRMKGRDEGTADDIPEMYREQFDNYQAYWDWRNQ